MSRRCQKSHGQGCFARDSRLGRDVAIKVLPQHLSTNAEVRARFEREAKTVSSLNHPNICVLHDIGREGETDYLVMELVDGETLAARLARGALPAADVIRIGSELADALDRAHRAGAPGECPRVRSGRFSGWDCAVNRRVRTFRQMDFALWFANQVVNSCRQR